MKYFIVLMLFVSCQLYAAERECFTKSDVAIVKEIFRLNDKEKLKAMALDQTKSDILSDQLLNDDNSTLSNISEVYYGWGKDKYSGHASEYGSKRFPTDNICVWRLLFTLPQKMSMKCDDGGIYGYFIDFKKVNGNIVIYDFTSLFNVLPNGTLACEAANDFMFSKKK